MVDEVLLKGIIPPPASDISILVGVPLKLKALVLLLSAVKQTSNNFDSSAKVIPTRLLSNQDKVILPAVVPLPGTPNKDSVNPDNPKLVSWLNSKRAGL